MDPDGLSIRDDVVVETEIDGAAIALPAFITNVLATELWLATRLPDTRIDGLTDGRAIHLAFDRGGALIVESQFLRRLGADSHPGVGRLRLFAVKRPQGVEKVQRRAHVRVDLERMVRIRSLGTLGSDKMGTGRTVNIGAGGVQFVTEMPLMFGQQLRIALVLTSGEIVVAGGPIVRIEDVGEPVADEAADPAMRLPTKLSLVAVRFDHISETDRERIAVYIMSAQRRQPQATSAEIIAAADAAADTADAAHATGAVDSAAAALAATTAADAAPTDGAATTVDSAISVDAAAPIPPPDPRVTDGTPAAQPPAGSTEAVP
jgi:hypothetical protein